MDFWSTAHFLNLTSRNCSVLTRMWIKDGVPIGGERVKAMNLREEDFTMNMMCLDLELVEARPIDELGEDEALFEQLFENSGG